MNFHGEKYKKMEDSGNFLFLRGKLTNSNKIVGFDLDGTLTVAKNGNDPVRYNSIGIDDWVYLGPVKEKIIELSKNYNIFIITNQTNISDKKKAMIEAVWNDLDRIPFVLCANKKNEFRKPNSNFINIIRTVIPNLDIANSYYCGDAVSPNDPFIPYRWDSKDGKLGADYQFAINCGLNFIRPIDVFGTAVLTPTEDIVMIMGTPASLKTTQAKILEQQYGYVRFSQDEVGELTKQADNIVNLLRSGKKVVLDATFPSNKKRLPWIELAHHLGKSMRIAWIIRNGAPFNALRANPISHHAYTGKFGYTPNFNDPRDIPNGYDVKVQMIY